MYVIQKKISNILMLATMALSIVLVLTTAISRAADPTKESMNRIEILLAAIIVIVMLVHVWFAVMNVLVMKTYITAADLRDEFAGTGDYDLSSESNIEVQYKANTTDILVTLQNKRRPMIFHLPSPYDPYTTVLRKQEFRRSWKLGFRSFTYVVNSRLVKRTDFEDIPISFGELHYLQRTLGKTLKKQRGFSSV
jgi:hypothetical protein